MTTVTRRHRRERRGQWGMTLGAVLGITVGMVSVTMMAVFPDQVERLYGDVQRDIGGFRVETLGEVPRVTLGASGGVTELDHCDGTFTEMLSYEHHEVPPVWAAHNNCGGDVALPWEVGQQVEVVREGEASAYEVVDVRITPKTWVTVDDLVGIDGDFALQTCFYGRNNMKFVGLRAVPADTVGADSGPSLVT